MKWGYCKQCGIILKCPSCGLWTYHTWGKGCNECMKILEYQKNHKAPLYLRIREKIDNIKYLCYFFYRVKFYIPYKNKKSKKVL